MGYIADTFLNTLPQDNLLEEETLDELKYISSMYQKTLNTLLFSLYVCGEYKVGEDILDKKMEELSKQAYSIAKTSWQNYKLLLTDELL
jgi:hypothetical protein